MKVKEAIEHLERVAELNIGVTMRRNLQQAIINELGVETKGAPGINRVVVKDTIYTYVLEHPGVFAKDIAHAMKLRGGLVHTALVRFVETGQLYRTMETDPATGVSLWRYYPSQPKDLPAGQEGKPTIRSRLIAMVGAYPGMTSSQLASQLGESSKSITAHCSLLIADHTFVRTLKPTADDERALYRYYLAENRTRAA